MNLCIWDAGDSLKVRWGILLGKIMTSQSFPCLDLHVILHGKEDSADVIEDMVYTIFAFPNKLPFYIINMYANCIGLRE